MLSIGHIPSLRCLVVKSSQRIKLVAVGKDIWCTRGDINSFYIVEESRGLCEKVVT